MKHNFLLLIICLMQLSFLPKSPQSSRFLFLISANNIVNDIPGSITIKIVNKEKGTIELNNLVLNFFIDHDSYWGTNESIRFIGKKLILKADEKFTKTFSFDSLTFTSFVNTHPVTINQIKEKIKKSKRPSLKASITDFWGKINPASSSFSVESNIIYLRNK